jgi:single-strand DNA-binding protein
MSPLFFTLRITNPLLPNLIELMPQLKTPQLTSTQNGDVVNFTLAINERWKDKGGKEQSHTDWFDIEVWGPMTKFASTLKSGTPVIVEGKVKPRTYTQDDVTHKTVSIKANSIRKIDYSQPSGSDNGDENQDADYPRVLPVEAGDSFGIAFFCSLHSHQERTRLTALATAHAVVSVLWTFVRTIPAC